jgi:acylphosphatase
MTSDLVSDHIWFSGRVQGVGFRWTTRRLAIGRGLTGWVRNCSDGRVEALFAGPRQAVDAVIAGLQDHFGSNLESIERIPAPDAAACSGFEVRATA